MRLALFSDIHANLEALETAVSHISDKKIGRVVVLGDTVGYGASPNECLEWVLKKAETVLTGNHERAVLDPLIRSWFNAWAREAIEWTENVLDARFKKKINGLPYVRQDSGLFFAHGSPDTPEEFRYLMSYQDAKPSFASFQDHVCFVGHTHVPCCFCEGEKSADQLKPGTLSLKKDERYILNPGSVGQPRDGDSRLAFGIYDDEANTFEIVRLNYDNEKAGLKIRKAGLPVYLADRLM